MKLSHLTLSTEGRLPLYDGEANLLRLIRILLRVGGEWIVLFSVVNDHLHLVIDHPRPWILGRSIRAALSAAFVHRTWQTAHVKPSPDQVWEAASWP